LKIRIKPLTAEGFAPFGEVLDTERARGAMI
jgi:ureidoglycolate hydrolase